MIKVTFKTPRAADLIRNASREVEKQIEKKARSAALPHGGVAVRFGRKVDGSLRSVEFEGAPGAVSAAKSAIAK